MPWDVGFTYCFPVRVKPNNITCNVFEIHFKKWAFDLHRSDSCVLKCIILTSSSGLFILCFLEDYIFPFSFTAEEKVQGAQCSTREERVRNEMRFSTGTLDSDWISCPISKFESQGVRSCRVGSANGVRSARGEDAWLAGSLVCGSDSTHSVKSVEMNGHVSRQAAVFTETLRTACKTVPPNAHKFYAIGSF